MNDRFERLLKSRIGLDASSVGSAVIERAVRQRMSGLALHDEDEYWMRLNGSPGEVQALIEAVVVPETWFFRYPESFATLARLAFERLPSLGGGRALTRISHRKRCTGPSDARKLLCKERFSATTESGPMQTQCNPKQYT
ncbi:UNVERIFIED_CONTAM: hypothetical protein O1L33_22500, partial [Pseudomonas aeruginosa]